MSNLTKGIILVVVILGIGALLVVWKKNGGAAAAGGSDTYNVMTRQEIELLLGDVAKTNPMVLKKLAEDPDTKKQQIENLRQLLAFASEAKSMGLTEEPTNKQELSNIRAEVLAVSYDREINKDKGPMPPFGFITEDMVNAFWADTSTGGSNKGFMDSVLKGGAPTETRSHEDEFNAFLSSKVELLKSGSPDGKEHEVTDEEKKQARDIFAKTRIYRNEFDQKAASGELDKEFVGKANLQVKLQQAQFLARLYSEKSADTDKVTDEEIAKYISEHPEIDPAQKRAKAQEILDKAKGGEDFAALADQYSEDPGNKGADGKGQGGLYKDVSKGRMVAPFEAAALALQPGQISPDLVETDFGYHIIKLERALGPSKDKDAKDAKDPKAAPGDSGETYDVRHILISTGVKDPDKPMARETPVKDYVRAKLETDKDKNKLNDLIAKNNVQVPDDFTVPEITDEMIQAAKQKQQSQMPTGQQPGGGPPPPSMAPKPDAKKPEGKKK